MVKDLTDYHLEQISESDIRYETAQEVAHIEAELKYWTSEIDDIDNETTRLLNEYIGNNPGDNPLTGIIGLGDIIIQETYEYPTTEQQLYAIATKAKDILKLEYGEAEIVQVIKHRLCWKIPPDMKLREM